jgi:hypothetical protein
VSDLAFNVEAQWQQRIHVALAKYTTADVVTEVRNILNQSIWEKVYPEKAASMQSITNEEILALVEVIDDNEHQANPEALTLAQTKGVYEYLEWPYDGGERDPEEWCVAYLRALCGEELRPSTARTPWVRSRGTGSWRTSHRPASIMPQRTRCTYDLRRFCCKTDNAHGHCTCRTEKPSIPSSFHAL